MINGRGGLSTLISNMPHLAGGVEGHPSTALTSVRAVLLGPKGLSGRERKPKPVETKTVSDMGTARVPRKQAARRDPRTRSRFLWWQRSKA